jgi:hypothetical protein
MTHDAAVWLANHITGPNAEKNPFTHEGRFGCFWCTLDVPEEFSQKLVRDMVCASFWGIFNYQLV